MAYDKEGNVKSQTDAKAKVTSMAYDARNRRTTLTDRLSGATTYNFHPAGHLASITCYGPNCDRIFGRIMTVGILGSFVG